MDEQQAPCVLLYHMKNHTYTSISDRCNVLNNNSEKILQRFKRQEDVTEELFYMDMNSRRYEVISVPFEEESLLLYMSPCDERRLYLSIEHEKMLRMQQHRLFELAKSKLMSKEAIESLIQEICQTITTVLEADRVSIWLFNEDKTSLQCQYSFNRNIDECFSDWVYEQKDAPLYFEQILNGRSFAVEDISEDAVLGYKFKYFQEVKETQSILEAPLVLSTGILGLLCCESFSKRIWTELNQETVRTLVDMISFLFERKQRIETENEMKQLAYVDQLTGLSNQYAFFELVNKKMQKIKGKEKGLMVYLKLDQFSDIQDVLGHAGGDEVIIHTANSIQEIFGDNGILGRIGFDHFAIFLPAGRDTNVAMDSIEQVTNQLLQPMYILGQEVYMTHSYGVSIYPDHGDDAKKCLQTAQIALNMGRKKNIRNVKARFTSNMFSVMANDLIIEMNMRRALDLNEFELYYQPQIDCLSGKIIGFESLIRWNHPERGLVTPTEFINLAESTGLIIPIGEWVIEQSFEQLEKWNVSETDEFTLSVNISPRHFLHASLYDYLKRSLEKYNVNPANLNIEITENVAMEDFTLVQARMEQLHQLGFTVSIDDFGTGFSAFQYLQHFPVNGIKIDRQFIQDIADNEKSFGITKTIIDLGKMMKLNIISEGVETVEQWKILKQLGCPQLQGYYFSKPMPIDEVKQWIHQYKSKSHII